MWNQLATIKSVELLLASDRAPAPISATVGCASSTVVSAGGDVSRRGRRRAAGGANRHIAASGSNRNGAICRWGGG
ncbi:MAG: hypothetical protein ING22_01155 [Burkholderiales bacterium]|nr:hypothetical protein [Burkholderiales bacterium]